MINWDLYKGITEGRHTKRSMRAFEEFCWLLENANYKLEGKYVNNSAKVELRCNKGHKYSVRPSHFKSGKRCPICSGCSKEHAKLEFIKQVDGEEYKVLGIYINAITKIELECNKGHKYFVKPNSFKNGNRCPICAVNNPEKSKLNFINQVEKEGYKLIGEYVNNNTKVELQCNKGHKYFVRPSDFKGGCRCPYCSNAASRGEVLTKKILDEYSYKYETQKKFGGLVGLNGGRLSYDFFVDDYLLIEVQGEQHYRAIEWYGGEEQYKKQQEHDRLKREFAKENGYELLEIPYFRIKDLDKLEKILREKLSKKYLIAS